MKQIIGCQVMINDLQVWYDNGEWRRVSKDDVVKAIRLLDEFEFIKDLYGVDYLISNDRKNPKDIIHLLAKAQNKILNECLKINEKYPDLNLDKIKTALRHFKEQL